MTAVLRTAVERVYEPLMAFAAIALAASVPAPYVLPSHSVWLTYTIAFSLAAYAVFLVDLAVRFSQAEHKAQFVRANWLEVLALLPIGLTGFLRWYRVFRSFVMLRRYSDFFHTVFLRHGFLYIFLITFGLVFAGAWVIHRVEPGLGNFPDALWWSFVTTTTVGYGDIAPKTTDGRLVAVVLMLLGIGFISVFTGSVATFFLGRTGADKAADDPHIAFLKERLTGIRDMSPDQYREFRAMLDAVHDGATSTGTVSAPPGS